MTVVGTRGAESNDEGEKRGEREYEVRGEAQEGMR